VLPTIVAPEADEEEDEVDEDTDNINIDDQFAA